MCERWSGSLTEPPGCEPCDEVIKAAVEILRDRSGNYWDIDDFDPKLVDEALNDAALSVHPEPSPDDYFGL